MRNCGQKFTAEHCLSIMLTGRAEQSYIRDSCIHTTSGRPIWSPSELSGFTITNNFLYEGMGNSIFLEHPLAMDNLISGNLIVNPIKTYTLDQSDLFPSAIRLANMFNALVGNHIGGSRYYGVFFDTSRTVQVDGSGAIFPYTFSPHPKTARNFIHAVKERAIELKYLYYADAYGLSTAIKFTRDRRYVLKGFTVYHCYEVMSISLRGVQMRDMLLVDNQFYLSVKASVSLNLTQGDPEDTGVSTLHNISFYHQIPGHSDQYQESVYINLPCSEIFGLVDIGFSTRTGLALMSACAVNTAGSYSEIQNVDVEQVTYYEHNTNTNNTNPINHGSILLYRVDSKTVIRDRDGSLSQKG